MRECALCDTHGFLVTARNAAGQAGTAARQKINKDTLIDFSHAWLFPIAMPTQDSFIRESGPPRTMGE